MIDLTVEYYNNTLMAWATALGIALAINLVLGILKYGLTRYFSRPAQGKSQRRHAAIVGMLKRTKQLLIFGVTLMIGTRYLDLSATIDRHLINIATVSAILQLGLWLSGALEIWVHSFRSKANGGAATSLGAVYFIARLVLWSLLALLMLDNLGVNVTALVAGLGVGGIAVALAAQNILGDLFASLSIVIDKPFVIGDLIEVGTFVGTVEHVGLKTTRVRSVTGEQIVIANGDLLQTRIRNFKRMKERRMTFVFGVTYQTTSAQLAAIPGWVKAIVETQPLTRFGRAHFRTFGGSSLDFEVVYWMTDPDFDVALDTQQAINLQLFERLAEEGVEFAYPTQTLFVQRQETVGADVIGQALANG